MIRNRLGPVAFGWSMILLASLARAAAAAPPEGAVTGSGRVVLSRTPQVLRMHITVTADGKDISEAAAKMKTTQEMVTKKLVPLGAIDKSIEFDAVRPGAGGDVRQQYMQRMMGMRGNRPGKPAAPVAPSVTVSSALKVEWALKATTPAEVLVEGYTLQEKIKAAALVAKPAATPEELEALEEAQGMQQGNGASPGDPSFQYVCKVSDDDQAAALADAFRKAKADAARVAKASGGDLGALHHLHSDITSPTASNESEDQIYQRMAMQQMMGITPLSAGEDPGEASGPTPGPVELRLVVTASFDLK